MNHKKTEDNELIYEFQLVVELIDDFYGIKITLNDWKVVMDSFFFRFLIQAPFLLQLSSIFIGNINPQKANHILENIKCQILKEAMN